MANVKIFLSPSNQTDNSYAYGNTTEGVQCGIVAKHLKAALERQGGIEVKLMHHESIEQKVPVANDWGADYYIAIHTNAANRSVGGTRIFYYTEGGKGQQLGEAIFRFLGPLTPGNSYGEGVRYNNLMETRMPQAACTFIETDFHDVPRIARWLIEHPVEIAEAICQGVCKHLGKPYIAPGKAKAEPKPVPSAKPAPAASEKKQLYRVRRSWANAVSQLIAASNIENAKKALKPGYFLYDWNGKPLYYMVENGDTLSGIAHRAYKDSNKWELIRTANKLPGTVIYPKQRLTIPKG